MPYKNVAIIGAGNIGTPIAKVCHHTYIYFSLGMR